MPPECVLDRVSVFFIIYVIIFADLYFSSTNAVTHLAMNQLSTTAFAV